MVLLQSLRRVGALSLAYNLRTRSSKKKTCLKSEEKVFKLNLSEDFSEDKTKI